MTSPVTFFGVALGVVSLASITLLHHATIWPSQIYAAISSPSNSNHDWADISIFKMEGRYKVFWNVGDWTTENPVQSLVHGFLPMSIVDPFSNRAGNGKQRIDIFMGKNTSNPWLKPEFFEPVVKADIAKVQNQKTLALDIEFPIETNISVPWQNKKIRDDSHTSSQAQFVEAYLHEWASWYALPLKWAKETQPNSVVGLYGRQPFQRDYWGIANKSQSEIEATHESDLKLWKSIDPYVDAYFIDIYNFYELPDSIFYMASNVELNYRNSRKFGTKPIYAYEWMRYHPSNPILGGRELAPYLIEAMAIVPFFSGADGLVLWGYEPQLKRTDGQPYQQLPLYAQSLKRVGELSKKMSLGNLEIDEPASVSWMNHSPLTRRIKLNSDNCILMAVNPWQNDGEHSSVSVNCGDHQITLATTGKHVTIAEYINGEIHLH